MKARRRCGLVLAVSTAAAMTAGACGTSQSETPSTVSRTTPASTQGTGTNSPAAAITSVCQALNSYESSSPHSDQMAQAMAASAATSTNASIRQAGTVMESNSSKSEAWKAAYVKVRAECVATGLTSRTAPA